MASRELEEVTLEVSQATSQTFEPFGHIVRANATGRVEPAEAALDLGEGRPRFYIMRLEGRGRCFDTIARHCRVTQCLASVGGRPWLLAVAPPRDLADTAAVPAVASIAWPKL